MNKRSCSIGLAALISVLSACGGGSGQSFNSGTPESTTTNTVTTVSTGTLSLKWVPPTTRSDGVALALSELGSYTVYFGTSIDELPYSVSIDDPSETSVDIPDLPAGTYYVVMTVTDRNGLESDPSGTAIKEVA